jgi:hypothetical protein
MPCASSPAVTFANRPATRRGDHWRPSHEVIEVDADIMHMTTTLFFADLASLDFFEYEFNVKAFPCQWLNV